MKCPRCDSLTVLVSRMIRYSRGVRGVEAESFCWECPTPHIEDRGRLHQFQDEMLSRKNDELAENAWQDAYGEPLPPSRYDVKKARRF